MANISDLIMQAVSASAGKVEIPSNIKNQVLGGLSESIIGSLTQTAAKANGVEQIKALLTGQTAAACSPVTALAGNLFSKNILSKLNLGDGLNKSLSGLIPVVIGKLGGILKDQDGDGDVDITDIILSLKGGSAQKNSGASILGAATGILGKILKK